MELNGQTQQKRVEKRNIPSLTPDQIRAVFLYADKLLATPLLGAQRRGLLAWVLMTTGLRISEVYRLDVSDINLTSQTLRVWRHKRYRQSTPNDPGWVKGVRYSGAVRDTIPIHPALAERMRAVIKAPSGPLWIITWNPSKRCAVRTLRQDWKRFARDSGIPGLPQGVHITRHTVGTLMGYTGTVFDVMNQLGHASIANASCYVDRNPWRMKEALKIAFDDMLP